MSDLLELDNLLVDKISPGASRIGQLERYLRFAVGISTNQGLTSEHGNRITTNFKFLYY